VTHTILVTGSRIWTDPKPVEALLHSLRAHLGARDPDLRLVLRHGDAEGLDRMAGRIALGQGWSTDVLPADWRAHGRRAGPIRNLEMIQRDPRPLACYGFPLGQAKGTWDCLMKAKGAGLPTHYYVAGEGVWRTL
jgi:hypothetical protein